MIKDYISAKRRGEREYRRAMLAGDYPYLPALETMVEGVERFTAIPVGEMEIPIERIVGTRTQSRSNVFARNFMPIAPENSEFAQKWWALYDAQIAEGIREPVKVYEFLNRFYVQEGNKRVSVLRFLGQPLILANVVRILPPAADTPENHAYHEFIEFFHKVPTYDFDFTEPGRYEELMACYGKRPGDSWTREEISDLRNDFAVFRRYFRAKGGDNLRIKAADAFLTYLSVYPPRSLRSESTALIDSRLDRLWKEFVLEESGNPVERIESTEGMPRNRNFLERLAHPVIYGAEHPLVTAFIYDKEPGNSSWVYGHELGRTDALNDFGDRIRALRYDNCLTDAQVREAVDDAVAQGAEMIFTISPAQMAETLRSAIHYPEVRFLNCSLNIEHSSVRSYAGRMYEAKFLMGALAASASENHRIGYMATYPIFGNIAGINAFAIGAGLIDPAARIYLTWSSVKNSDWRRFMEESGVDVISGPDLIRPQEASREFGIYKVEADGIHNLAMPLFNWGRYYELILRSVLEGNYDAQNDHPTTNYWLGMNAGVIDVILSGHLSYYSRKMVEGLREAILNGAIHPFAGELHSQHGIIKDAASPIPTSQEIITMNWLNDNVIGEIPEEDELSEDAMRAVQVSGVRESAEGKETS